MEWLQVGILGAILLVMLLRWLVDDWARWQGYWFKLWRRRKG